MANKKKMRWVDAIERVLEESDKPLHSEEIARRAIANGWASDDSATPEHSVQAAVYRHINDCGNTIGFEMVGEGRQNRFYWLLRKKGGRS